MFLLSGTLSPWSNNNKGQTNKQDVRFKIVIKMENLKVPHFLFCYFHIDINFCFIQYKLKDNFNKTHVYRE